MARQGSSASELELGFRNIAARIARIYPEAIGACREAVQRAGLDVVRITQATVPIDTSFMHDHTKVIFSRDGLEFDAGWDEADFTAAGLPFYPIFVEFGTRKMTAQPSLGPAYAEVKPRFQDDVSRLVREAIERRANS